MSGLGTVLLGCTLAKLSEESKAYYASTVLVGRVDCPSGCAASVVVAALRHTGEQLKVVHRSVLHEPGGYELIVPQGEYTVFAFGDNNGNGVYDAGEPAGEQAGDDPVLVPRTGVVSSIDLLLGTRPARPLKLAPPTPFDAAAAVHPSRQAGALADLDAPRFSAENGSRGYWAPMEFFSETGGNVYFLDPYDPHKIPILFVHGAAGSAQDWRYFFEHIDRSRYQPWFFQYPSGASMDSMAYLLYWKLFNLQLRYRFDTLYITAHSMGGLLSRTFLLKHGDQFPQVKLLVTLSTPWAGESSADTGVKHSPAVVPSWHDMRPEGAFMKELFARPLPAGVDYYLLFGHKGGYSMLRPNNDGTVTLASQLRNPAQAEARMVYGFDEDHVSILSSPLVLAQYGAILDSAGKQRGEGPGAGRVRVSFSFDSGLDGPKGLPLLMLRPVNETPRQRRTPLTIALTGDDSGRQFGPIPVGDYEASLVVASFRSEPHKLRVRVDNEQATELSFRLTPQGMLNGYVSADPGATGSPAGSYRPPHETINITAITLEGAGTRRTLVPRRSGGEHDFVEHYVRGEDDAYRAAFSFVGLAEGDYELTILAEGYRPFKARHSVVPGRPGPWTPIVMEPLR